MKKRFTYRKKEKLKSRKQLSALFAAKQSFLHFPVKVFYLQPEVKTGAPVKAGVGANSRNFKKAVHRNLIKRLLREAYRLHKLPLHQQLMQQEKEVVVFFLYIDKVLPAKGLLDTKMPFIIRELMKRLDENIPQNS